MSESEQPYKFEKSYTQKGETYGDFSNFKYEDVANVNIFLDIVKTISKEVSELKEKITHLENRQLITSSKTIEMWDNEEDERWNNI
ncbi:MAG: hypothetical protein ACLFN8_00255 [Candidatus Woesearchaeota archaeon]